MKIHHVGVWTENLERMREFYTQYFDGKAGEKYTNSKTGFTSYFLSFGEGATLELMHHPEVWIGKKDGERRQGMAHLAFSVGCREKVDELTQRLMEIGCTLEGGPRVTGDGYYESCVQDLEGNLVEITV